MSQLTRDEECILDAGVLEEGCAVVENEVDACKLLPCLEEDTGKGAEGHPVIARFEAIHVRELAERPLRHQVLLHS
jgi:hypothetical protein